MSRMDEALTEETLGIPVSLSYNAHRFLLSLRGEGQAVPEFVSSVQLISHIKDTLWFHIGLNSDRKKVSQKIYLIICIRKAK